MAQGQEVQRRGQALRPRPAPHRRPRPSTWSRAWPPPSSTRPSSWPSASASTPARPTRSCAARSRCPRAPARTSGSPCSPPARPPPSRPRGRRRLRRRRRPRRRGRGRHARLRRRHRHARPHAPGRPARPGARPPRPHAEPQDRHRHHRRRPRPSTEFKGGKVEYRTDRYGNVHVPIGKVSFDPDALLANFRAVLDELERAKPASAKGRYIRKVALAPPWAPASRSTPTA